MTDKKIGNEELMNRLLSAHEHIGELREENGTVKFQLSEERAKNSTLRSDLEYWKSHASSVERQIIASESALRKLRETVVQAMCERTGFESVAAYRIGTIKEVRTATNLGLREAKDLVDSWLTSKGWKNPHVAVAATPFYPMPVARLA